MQESETVTLVEVAAPAVKPVTEPEGAGGQVAERPAKRFSWWLGLGLFLASAGISFGGLYFLVVPRLGNPVPVRGGYRTARAFASERASIVWRPEDHKFEVSWRLLNFSPVEWSTLDVKFVPVGDGLETLPLPGGLDRLYTKTIQTVLPGEAPADAAWQLQGPFGPVPGGLLKLGGPHGMTLAEWQENLLRVGNHYPVLR